MLWMLHYGGPCMICNLYDSGQSQPIITLLVRDMISTVTIMRLASEHWRFLSCQLCHKKAFQAVNAFVCSNKRCNCTTATPRDKVRVIGADTTGEVEFVYFATVAEQIIGKRLEVVLRSARPLAVLVVPIVNFCRKNTNMASSSSIE